MLSISTMQQICGLAGYRVNPVKKTVNWVRKDHEVTGFEVYKDGALVATHFDYDGHARILAPGEYYEHTTLWNDKTTFAGVLKQATDKALLDLREGLRG